jgi:hypothetical protein
MIQQLIDDADHKQATYKRLLALPVPTGSLERIQHQKLLTAAHYSALAADARLADALDTDVHTDQLVGD